jgi:hypothetical protein
MLSDILSFAAPGGFGAGAFNRARQAGYTDLQIKQALAGSDLKIGQRVNYALNPETYGNDMAQRGAREGGFTDAGSGAKYGMRAVMLPDDLKDIGGGLGNVWAAGPMTDEQIINMYRNGPRSSWALPASVDAPGKPYKAPAGTPYMEPLSVDPSQSQYSYYTQQAQNSSSPSTPLRNNTRPMPPSKPRIGGSSLSSGNLISGDTSTPQVRKRKSTSLGSISSGLNIGLM